MKRLDVPIILANASSAAHGEQHACGGRCTGKPRKDGFCYHDGGTKHRIGQCRSHHAHDRPVPSSGQ